jgi:hypothetical protein
MADTADIEKALTALAATVLGLTTYGTNVVSTALGLQMRLYRGWPTRRQLDADLGTGVSHITVFPRPQEHNVTRYFRPWEVTVAPVHTETATISGTTVTLGGTISVPQNIALVVNEKGYVHSTVSGDTLSSVASVLATLVSVDTPATASGASIAIPAATRLIARVGGVATAMQELKRQLRTYQVTCWCPTPQDRDALAGPLDVGLSIPQRLYLPDGTAARLRYSNSLVDDDTQKVGTFRRDLFYTAEFGTTQTIAAPEVVLARSDYLGGVGTNQSSYYPLGSLEA